MSEPAEILVVCTGNVCRSPLAERLLRVGLDTLWGAAARDEVRVHSAGVGALVGEPMHPDSATQLRRFGGDEAGFVSRQLMPSMTASADLVLAMTRAHRASVVEGFPRAARITFTLREVELLLDGCDPSEVTGETAAERVRGVALLAQRRRGSIPQVPPKDLDVVDPYGGRTSQHQLMANQIAPAIAALLRLAAPLPR